MSTSIERIHQTIHSSEIPLLKANPPMPPTLHSRTQITMRQALISAVHILPILFSFARSGYVSLYPNDQVPISIPATPLHYISTLSLRESCYIRAEKREWDMRELELELETELEPELERWMEG